MIRIILATNEDKKYYQFWSLVCSAWSKFLPEAKVACAFITERSDDNPLVKKMRLGGDVHLFKPVAGVPSGNQAKLAMYYLASLYPNDVCVVTDIDLIPLQRKYIRRLLEKRKKNHMLCVGQDVYDDPDYKSKFPTSYNIAEGKLFKKLLNPRGLGWEKFIKSFADRVPTNTPAENALAPPDFFSLESLICVLIDKNKTIKIQKLDRGFDARSERLDRSYWYVDEAKLFNGGYVDCHAPRPMDMYYNMLEVVVRYVRGPLLSYEIIFDDEY